MRYLAVVPLLHLALAAAWAQTTPISAFRVYTEPPGARFRVDGFEYYTAATFLWPAGSKHILQFESEVDGYQYNDVRVTRYVFSGWTDSTGLLLPSAQKVITITADPTVIFFKATLTVEHRVFMLSFDGSTAPPVGSAGPALCGAPGDAGSTIFRAGIVYVDDTCYWSSVLLWLQQGPHILNAFPYPGFVFGGWVLNNSPPNAFLRTVDVRGPMTISARFEPGRRMKFLTEPMGLNLLIDRTTIPTPDALPCVSTREVPSVPTPLPGLPPGGVAELCIGEFDWALDSQHTLAAASPQNDRRAGLWVFDSFSTGGGQNSIYKVAALMPAETITGRFVRGVRAGFLTTPGLLKLKIDGRENWPSYNFVWAVGSEHQASAQAEQTDARGRRYVFRRWSNGGAATQTVKMPLDASGDGFVLTAHYDVLSQMVVHSNPPGALVQVDGVDCRTPCTVDRESGAEVRISLPPQVAMTETHRLEFVSWSDGGARDHTVTLAGVESRTITANYRSAYLLVATEEPAGAARCRLDPPSTDGFYPSDTPVTIAIDDQPGYRFRRWEGDLAGTSRTGFLRMSGPRFVRAVFDRVPYIAPAGVRNAAGETPEAVVAPGSLVSVHGGSLAPQYETGSTNPLAQTLAGVVLLVGQRILPLLFVSPEQINALLPADLGEGEQTVKVRWGGQPEISGTFTVARNAPGLFSRTVEGKQFAAAVHEDGTPVTPESPARRNEVVKLYGTGFGRYDRPVPDGFALPSSPVWTLEDKVEILAGDWQPPTIWAGGAAGMVGAVEVRLRIGDEAPAGSTIELKVRVNGRESNTVLLPIE